MNTSYRALSLQGFSRVAAVPIVTLLVLASFAASWLFIFRLMPFTDWPPDALAVSLIALACLVPVPGTQLISFSRTTIFACAMLVLVGLLAVTHKAIYPQQYLLPAGAFMAMALLARRVQHLTFEPSRREWFLDMFAWALVLSSFTQAAIGLTQQLGLSQHFNGWLLTPSPGAPVFGNLGQRNIFAQVVALGLPSACWLHARGRLRWRWLLPFLVFCSAVMAWSGARLVLAYGAGMILLALCWRLRSAQDVELKRFSQAACLAGALVLLMQGLGASLAHLLTPDLGHQQIPVSGYGRLFDADSSMRRWSEWGKFLDGFLQSPILGLGWGQGAYQSAHAELFGQFAKVPDGTLSLHAHNLVIHLLAETGVLGAAVALGGITWCLMPSLRRAAPDSLFMISLAMIVLIHSQFEYPLWYLPGLALFTVVLACASAEPVFAPAFSLSWRQAANLVCSVILLAYVITGVKPYLQLSEASKMPSKDWPEELVGGLQPLQNNPFWMWETEQVFIVKLVSSMTPANTLAQLSDMAKRQVAYRPFPAVLLRDIQIRSLQGDASGAKSALAMLLAVDPHRAKEYLRMVKEFDDPALAPIERELADFVEASPAALPRP
jgi:O-antigen ligase